MTKVHFLVERAPDGGCAARAVGADIFNEGDDLPMLRERLRDAVQCHFDQADESILIHLGRLTACGVVSDGKGFTADRPNTPVGGFGAPARRL